MCNNCSEKSGVLWHKSGENRSLGINVICHKQINKTGEYNFLGNWLEEIWD